MKRTFKMILLVFGLATAMLANPIAVFAAPAEPLDESETSRLLFIREEEKLARDVYLTLAESYDTQIFDNISASEQNHMDAILKLLNRYGLADPALQGIGEFSVLEISDLYTSLIERGVISEAEAFLVGGYIEEFDILDLWHAMEETDEAQLDKVYANLCEGSYSHLVAFVGLYEKLSATDYEPQIMTDEEFERALEEASKLD
ncbi:MAG: DUF2202 domain-containing protein [Clostridia bacterium]|nr:DUF2202 domain-containing protein [Clostridia bacterium]NCC75717.1 DUF2202 domain-containing protein [Clostridia bacterium]